MADIKIPTSHLLKKTLIEIGLPGVWDKQKNILIDKV